MATVPLSENPIFEEVVRRVETNDFVLGGEPNTETGAAAVNVLGLQLANRTRWLKDAIAAMYTNGQIDTAIAAAVGVLTAAEILTRLKTVDGAGTGLDADLLDGQHGSAFWRHADSAFNTSIHGYQTFPSGLILQWGEAVGAGVATSVLFPIAFPNAVLQVIPIDVAAAGSAENAHIISIMAQTQTQFTFMAWRPLDQTFSQSGMKYMAVGY